MREKVSSPGFSKTGPQWGTCPSHEQDDSNIPLKIKNEIGFVSFPHCTGGSRPTRLRAPGGPWGIDEAKTVDEGQSPGQFFVPPADRELDLRIRGELPESRKSGEGHHEITEAIETKRQDAFRCRNVRKVAARWAQARERRDESEELVKKRQR
jgi:hypothetical protein